MAYNNKWHKIAIFRYYTICVKKDNRCFIILANFCTIATIILINLQKYIRFSKKLSLFLPSFLKTSCTLRCSLLR